MIAGIVITAVFLSCVAALLIYEFKRRVWIWSPLLCEISGAQYVAPASVDPSTIARALERAAAEIGSRRWGAAAVVKALTGVRVFVVDGLEWHNIAGQTVGGEQDGSMLRVGRDLSSLAHEAAHLCEALIDLSVDESHALWPANGLGAADEAYRAWLKR